MPVDPRPIPGSPAESAAAKLADLERRVAALERNPLVMSGAGPPSGAAATGTPYLDTANNRWYVYSGGWRYANLT